MQPTMVDGMPSGSTLHKYFIVRRRLLLVNNTITMLCAGNLQQLCDDDEVIQ